jgi:hypothetical protein
MFNGEFVQRHQSIAKDGTQGVRFEAIYDLRAGGKPHKVRITIISDAYKTQSVAKVERFSGSVWQQIGRLAHGEMVTPEGLCYGKPATPSAFAEDVEALQALTLAVLS